MALWSWFCGYLCGRNWLKEWLHTHEFVRGLSSRFSIIGPGIIAVLLPWSIVTRCSPCASVWWPMMRSRRDPSKTFDPRHSIDEPGPARQLRAQIPAERRCRATAAPWPDKVLKSLRANTQLSPGREDGLTMNLALWFLVMLTDEECHLKQDYESLAQPLFVQIQAFEEGSVIGDDTDGYS